MTARKELKQEPEEMITLYYERVVDMMGHLHTRSRCWIISWRLLQGDSEIRMSPKRASKRSEILIGQSWRSRTWQTVLASSIRSFLPVQR